MRVVRVLNQLFVVLPFAAQAQVQRPRLPHAVPWHVQLLIDAALLTLAFVGLRLALRLARWKGHWPMRLGRVLLALGLTASALYSGFLALFATFAW